MQSINDTIQEVGHKQTITKKQNMFLYWRIARFRPKQKRLGLC